MSTFKDTIKSIYNEGAKKPEKKHLAIADEEDSVIYFVKDIKEFNKLMKELGSDEFIEEAVETSDYDRTQWAKIAKNHEVGELDNGMTYVVPKKLMSNKSIVVIDSGVISKNEGLQSSFCMVNRDINKFASENPDNMFLVMAEAMFSIEKEWSHVHEFFPQIAAFLLDTNGEYKYAGNVISKYETREMSAAELSRLTGTALGALVRNRQTIYDDIYNGALGYEIVGNDPESIPEHAEVALFRYLLHNIPFLEQAKAGFITQLLIGKLGCLDSVNRNIMGFPVDLGNESRIKKDLSKNKMEFKRKFKGIPKQKRLSEIDIYRVTGYIDYLNGLAELYKTDNISKVMWDVWAEVVAARTLYAKKAPEKAGGSRIGVNTLLKGKNGKDIKVDLHKYSDDEIDVNFTSKIKNSIDSVGGYGGHAIGDDHLNLPHEALGMRDGGWEGKLEKGDKMPHVKFGSDKKSRIPTARVDRINTYSDDDIFGGDSSKKGKFDQVYRGIFGLD